MSLMQWEHQLFCYDWLFYKCFSVSLCRNVLTRSGYWLLMTQLNCLYCTPESLYSCDQKTARLKKNIETEMDMSWNEIVV